MKRYAFRNIEKKWQKRWREDGTYEPNIDSAKKPFYNLMMFPYPSAEGLHVGNVYAFTGADIYGRFKRMQGYDVFEPIGLDGFGIHSENYALKIGTHPMEQAKISEKRFYRQLEAIGNGFAWNERLETYDPTYYRWTQWIFTQMWKHGLAYRKEQSVNWCPSCKTVLADEQVINEHCERCNSTVKSRELEQWFFRITKYAERLLNNLENIDWSERVKIAQRNWIGKSEGALIKFEIQSKTKNLTSNTYVEVFTTRPDTLFGATYVVLAPEHELVSKLPIKNQEEVKKYIKHTKSKTEQERIEHKDKTGVELVGVKAINPANKELIPIFIADYVLPSYGTGAIMAVPAHDTRDWKFAKKFDLPIKMVICTHYPAPTCPVLKEAYEGDGHLVDSGKFDGMKSKEAMWKITKHVGGKHKTQYRIRDWLISRQRYWGVPIPMIFCKACAADKKGEQKDMPGWYAVPEKDLPVELPYIEKFRPEGTGKSPLASVPEFYETTCPGCNEVAQRETDVSDTFLDSAWYYLRYPSASDKQHAWNPKTTKRWLPVNLYTGGAEHSVLHLLYVRFVALALQDMKLLSFPAISGEEPFPKFRAHGLIIKDGAKMSKSRGNVVNPDEYIERFGADTLRMYLMFLAPFEEGGDFRDAGMLGIVRFLDRVWKLFQSLHTENQMPEKKKDVLLQRILHKTIKKVSEDIEVLKYNTAISALMVLLSAIEEHRSHLSVANRQLFLKLLAPFAPHITEELWYELGNKTSIHTEPWPKHSPKFIKEDTFELVIQVNGKVRDTITLPRGITETEAKKAALASEAVQKHLNDRKLKKVVFVKDRLINFVV